MKFDISIGEEGIWAGSEKPLSTLRITMSEFPIPLEVPEDILHVEVEDETTTTSDEEDQEEEEEDMFIVDEVVEEDETTTTTTDEEDQEDEDEEYIQIVTENGNTRRNPSRRNVSEEQDQPPIPQISSNSVEVIQVDNGSSGEQGECSTSSASKKIGNESEGAFCPICMESWSSEGIHQVCCLPCGHVYGFSCIDKWIRQCRRNSAKCPQCSRKCGVKDIIKLYAPRITGIDGELQKNVLSLRAENDFLKLKIASLEEKICQAEEEKLRKEACHLGNISSEETRRRTSEFITSAVDFRTQTPSGHTLVYSAQGSSCCTFELEDEFMVDGARIFDLDASNRILILARRLQGMGGNHVLTKISLMYPYDSETIQLPPNTKAVKDLHISPCAGKLALFASLGKKLSIVSMESNNIVLTYDLPAPAWSCSWDLSSPHHLYAGLQSGMLLVFDMRQTAKPMESIHGLTCYPIHTVHSVVQKSSIPCDTRTILSASSTGPCVWNTGGVGERPFLVPELENQGVCISVAYCPSTDDIVASFRPKVQMPNDGIYTQTQPSLSPPSTVSGRGTLGSHILMRRVAGSCYKKLASCPANVNDVRMLKSAIVNIANCNPLFASGDEATHGLTLQELPSLRVTQTLQRHEHPILDVKFSASAGQNLLGSISEDKLKLFSARLS